MTTTPKTTRSEELTSQSQLVRTVEANLKIHTLEDPLEKRFRTSLLARAEEALREMPQGLVTRLYEAACDVKYSTPDVINFRNGLHKQIGHHLGLRKFHQPATPNQAKK